MLFYTSILQCLPNILLGEILFSSCASSLSKYKLYFWHHIELQATKKIADAKLAKDFQAVLKEFQKAQWLAVEREASLPQR
jgi:hypothetical protein